MKMSEFLVFRTASAVVLGMGLVMGAVVAPLPGFQMRAFADEVGEVDDYGTPTENGGGEGGNGGGHHGCGPHFTVDDYGNEHHGPGGGEGGGGGGGGQHCGGGGGGGGHHDEEPETDDYGNPVEDEHTHEEDET